MKLYVLIALMAAGLSCISCSQSNENASAAEHAAAVKNYDEHKTAGLMPGYALDAPDQIEVLPDILEEASGLTDVSLTQVAMVQDELGVIFLYDIPAGEILQTIPFGPPGDYEGMTRIDDTMFVLQSNGNLFEVRHWLNSPVVEKHTLQLPTADNEGLCFDPVENALLIAPKSRWKKGKEAKAERPIFSVVIESRELNPEPSIILNTNDLIDFAMAHGLDIPKETTKKGKEKLLLSFKPASLAVHPETHDIYIISAADQVLASFNRKGEVTGLQFLDKRLFPKAEGITFLPDSTLVIVSEAGDQVARIMTFKMKRGADKGLLAAASTITAPAPSETL